MVKEPAFHEVPLNYDTCVKNSEPFYGIPYKYLHRQKSISEVAVSSEKTRIQSPKNSEDSNDEKSSMIKLNTVKCAILENLWKRVN